MRYAFGDYTLDTDTLELTAAESPVEVEPQVFSLLVHLIERRDRVVSKEELLDGIWGDRFVSESALTTRIKQARQAVGDTGQRQAVIKTLHGRGYRFVADVGEPSPQRQFQYSVMKVPTTRYAKSDGVAIAYQTFGEGPNLVLIAGFTSNIELQWEQPVVAAFLRRLGSFARVTVLDKRGVGLSDRMPDDNPPSLETRADDLRAVMDSAGIDTATLLGSSEGGSLSIVFAASHPERVHRLILHGTWVREPWSSLVDAQARTRIEERWGTGNILGPLAPTLDAIPGGREFLARYERQSGTPHAATALRNLSAEIDVSAALPAISVPTLVLHRRDDPIIKFEKGQEVARLIKGARLVALDGKDHYLFSGDVGALLDEIEEFVTSSAPDAGSDDTVLATVLFVTVDATEAPRGRFSTLAKDVIDRFRGTLVSTTDDSVVATFDGPGRAVHAAGVLRDELLALGLQPCAGLQTAEIQRRGDDIAGVGVQIANEIARIATPGEVWVSRTVTDLVAGTGLTFAERGEHRFDEIDGTWPLFAALV